MTEFDNFTTRPSDEDAAQWSQELVAGLQNAIGAFDEPLRWQISDGLTVMEADPLIAPEDPLEPPVNIPYGNLRHMPYIYFLQNMGEWAVARTALDLRTGTVMAEQFLISPNGALGASAVGSMIIFEEGSYGDFARNALNDDMKRAMQNPQPASIHDYANLFNALHDLRPLASRRLTDYLDYLRSASPEEKRNIRAMRREWAIEPESSKTSTPRWWGISYFNQVWLVKASSADEAVLDLEDHLERGVEPLEMFFADPYNEAIQAELTTKYTDGRTVRRLIPFSLVEWPDDPESMSGEQQAAMEALRRP